MQMVPRRIRAAPGIGDSLKLSCPAHMKSLSVGVEELSLRSGVRGSRRVDSSRESPSVDAGVLRQLQQNLCEIQQLAGSPGGSPLVEAVTKVRQVSQMLSRTFLCVLGTQPKYYKSEHLDQQNGNG